MTWRKRDEVAAQRMARIVGNLPIIIVPVTIRRALRAAEIKARYSSAKAQFSYADAIATALAEELGCEVATGDPEFRQVESIIRVRWLRTSLP